MSRVTPFYRALIEPRLMMGMDSSLLGLLAIVSFGLTMASRTLWPIAAGVLVGVALRSLFATDPLYMAVYGRYCREADEYEPWAKPGAERCGRRAGRGRGVLC